MWKMSFKKYASQEGFALIEVLTALAILSFSLATLLGGFTSAQRNIMVARDRIQSTALAAQALEEARQEASDDFDAFSFSGDKVFQEGAFQVTRKVSPNPNGWEDTALVEIRASRDGKESVRLSAVFHRGGV